MTQKKQGLIPCFFIFDQVAIDFFILHNLRSFLISDLNFPSHSFFFIIPLFFIFFNIFLMFIINYLILTLHKQ